MVGNREDIMVYKQSPRSLSLIVFVSVGFLFLTPSLALAASVDLARTGQAACYNQAGQVVDCAGTGQDGEYQKGVPWPDPRFTDNGDGTITDNLSGLIWLQNTQCIGRKKWLDALDAVNALADESCGLTDGSVAGDWRMPNYLELISIANLGVANSIAWFTDFGFINLQAYGYWSSTSSSQMYSSAFSYQFRDRFGGISGKSSSYQTWPVKGVSTGPARIWRTGQTDCYDASSVVPCAGTGQDGEYQAGEPHPDTRFVDNTDGTVTDNLTGLIWLQNTDCFGLRVWEDALSDANSLANGACGLTDGSAAGDWRLPNTLEIVSLTDFSQTPTMLTTGHPFTNVTFKMHWASTTWMALSNRGYHGGLNTWGIYGYSDKSSAESLIGWPVRGGYVNNLPESVFEDGFE